MGSRRGGSVAWHTGLVAPGGIFYFFFCICAAEASTWVDHWTAREAREALNRFLTWRFEHCKFFMQCLLNILRKQINFSQFSWDYYSKIMTQDVLFAGGAAEKPPQIPEECFCRETTVLCDDPDPSVRVLLLPGVHRPLPRPTSHTLHPPGKHVGHSPTVSHENSSWSKQCALKNCNGIKKNQNEPLVETWKLSCAICFVKIQMEV